jgi:hypothetical protein
MPKKTNGKMTATNHHREEKMPARTINKSEAAGSPTTPYKKSRGEYGRNQHRNPAMADNSPQMPNIVPSLCFIWPSS